MTDLPGLIPAFARQKILVVGDAILDVYARGVTEKLCREAPAPVVQLRAKDYCCGGAANTAFNIASLGARTVFLTVLGADEHGAALENELRRGGVDTTRIVRDAQRRSIAKTRVAASSSILIRIDEGSTQPVGGAARAALHATLRDIHAGFDGIVIADYGGGVVTEELIATLRTLRRRGTLVVDARDPRRFASLRPTAVKPNYAEALRILGVPAKHDGDRVRQIVAHGERLLELTGARHVAATLDADGSVLFERGRRPCRIPCVPQQAAKTIGAGDSFVAAMTLALCAGADARDAARMGAAAAAVALRKEGTRACTPVELRAYFSGNMKLLAGLDDLRRTLDELRNDGRKIVFTNGCFDLLHRGHVRFLNRARALGDALIVGLNDDAGIRRLKGPGRPINTLADRIEVLSGLHSVNHLIAFSADSPIEILKAARPDVFVKGGTYTTDALPETELVRALGGEVRILPLQSDCSTASLIDRIRATPATHANAPSRNVPMTGHD